MSLLCIVYNNIICSNRNSLNYFTDGFTMNTVCHAVVNAIANRTIPDLTACTMYITRHPDEDCAHLIVQSGIKKVKYMRNVRRRNPDHEENARRILLLGNKVSHKYVEMV